MLLIDFSTILVSQFCRRPAEISPPGGYYSVRTGVGYWTVPF